jgi:hypothetical protein
MAASTEAELRLHVFIRGMRDLFGHQSWDDVQPIAERAWNMASLLDASWADIAPTVQAAWPRDDADALETSKTATLHLVGNR